VNLDLKELEANLDQAGLKDHVEYQEQQDCLGRLEVLVHKVQEVYLDNQVLLVLQEKLALLDLLAQLVKEVH
jgi:hypothetical protein